MKDDGDAAGPKNKASEISDIKLNGETSLTAVEEKTSGKYDGSSDGDENTDIEQTSTATRTGTEHAVEEDKTTSKVEDSDLTNKHVKQKILTSTEYDAVLALQLHEEEVNLVKSANRNREDERWEEVTIKKRKA